MPAICAPVRLSSSLRSTLVVLIQPVGRDPVLLGRAVRQPGRRVGLALELHVVLPFTGQGGCGGLPRQISWLVGDKGLVVVPLTVRLARVDSFFDRLRHAVRLVVVARPLFDRVTTRANKPTVERLRGLLDRRLVLGLDLQLARAPYLVVVGVRKLTAARGRERPRNCGWLGTAAQVFLTDPHEPPPASVSSSPGPFRVPPTARP